ncbi:MAG: 3'-5' exoribonuclease [Bacteroidales bacterium]|nr:3'-5' exoribonuclease [Bacteroidales bacterium]
MDFTAIDFETALGKRWSICQVGIVRIENGEITKILSRLIKPPNNEYSEWNTRIHGITPDDTINAPSFIEIWNEIKPYIENKLVVAHNIDFDIDCLNKTLEYYFLPKPKFETDCTYKRTGQKLDDLCEAFDVELENHHNAKSDATACAEIYIKLLNNEEPDLSKIKIKSRASIFQQKGHERIKGDILKPDLANGDPSSPFFGRKVVFTGVLKSIARHKAAEIVKMKGADIDTGITKKTNFVITGNAPGYSKMRKIEKYNSEGSQIKIIFEEEFLEMI